MNSGKQHRLGDAAQRMRKRSAGESARPRPSAWHSAGLRPLWLGAATVLVVATPLVPSEAATQGISVLLVLGWLLWLLGYVGSGAAAGRLELRMGMPELAAVGFLLLHTVSGLVMLGEGQPRQTLNMLWHWVGLILAYLLLRQLVRHAIERRAMASVLIGLALCLSVHGYYQYFHSLPQTRQAYERNPDQTLAEAGIMAPPGSRQRVLFENRLYSLEPLSTFTLTNSLAGFLAPWLVCVMGIAVRHWKDELLGRSILMAALLSGLPIAGCLLLTKSRTAWLAVCLGLAVLALGTRRTSCRTSWKVSLAIIAAAVLLAALAAAIGGLDALVLTEALKSISYRLEYWRSTVAMIREYPWLGCGPGNFQQYYTAYKLPMASEAIADPHNFLLEVWATAGSLTALAFLAIFVAAAWSLWRHAVRANDSTAVVAPTAGDSQEAGSSLRSIYGGALLGLPVGVGIGFVVGFVPEGSDGPLLLLVWFALMALSLWWWHAWTVRGSLPLIIPAAALVTVLANLSAAGGISFAGVSINLWLLLAIALSEDAETTWVWRVERWPALILAATAAILLWLFIATTFQPVMKLSTSMAEASILSARQQPAQAEQVLLEAARIDPYSDQPWRELASLRQGRWLATRRPDDEALIREAMREWLSRNRRSSAAEYDAGVWFVHAYRATGEHKYLQDAIEHLRRAVELYPSSNLTQAQLAWILHLAGRDREAEETAAEALRLDALNPHSEQKLARQRIYDVNPADSSQPSEAGSENAEQLMQRLRNAPEESQGS